LKTVNFYGAVFALAVLTGLIISSVAPANVSAGPYDPVPQPDHCVCYDSYQCADPSPNCDYNPALIARVGIDDCAIECGWTEVGCCIEEI